MGSTVTFKNAIGRDAIAAGREELLAGGRPLASRNTGARSATTAVKAVSENIRNRVNCRLVMRKIYLGNAVDEPGCPAACQRESVRSP